MIIKRKSIMIMIISLMMISLTNINCYASSLSYSSTYEITENDSENVSDSIEKELQKTGSSVLNELYKLKTEYQKTLSESEDALLQSQLTDLINTTQELIDIYYASHNTDANRNTNRFHLAICANGNDNYLTNPELYASYCNNVSAVIAYFNMKGYKLAAELLTHARSNTSPSSTYLPTYGNRVRNSSIFTTIANGTKTKGSATFPNSGTKYEKDLYYAIHKFNYTKTSASSKTVRITDTYDYVSSGDYTGVAGVAVSVMADAQRFGVITPYTVLITCKAS